jgi:hypothetical protein
MRRTLLGVPVALAAALVVLPTASPVQAQELEIERSSVPRDLADRLIGIANDPATARLSGGGVVPADSVIATDLVVMGSLRLDGRVVGDLIVVNGDVDLGPDAQVTGNLTVVGGEVRGDDVARIGGTLMAFQSGGPRFLSERATTDEDGFPNGVEAKFDRAGHTGFDLEVGNYNRLEGLPVSLGPTFNTGGNNPFRAQALAIWRTEGRAPFQHDRLGYFVEGEQFIGGRRELRVAGGVYSMVSPIEAWGLTDSENSLSAFLFTSDQRDYLERRGVQGYVRVTPRKIPVDLRVGYREERTGSVAPQDPWTLFSRGHPWRDQPLVAEGTIQTVFAVLEVDTRDHLEEPRSGWFVRATWDEGVGGDFAVPTGSIPGSGPELLPLPVDAPPVSRSFSSAFVDIRRYNPAGRSGNLNLRAVVGGSPSGEVLPPQHQVTLGGAGTLPGHPLFAADCGARNGFVTLERDGVARPMVPFYGCDRVALFQAEYRGSIGGFFGWDGRSDRSDRSGYDPYWVVFFDAGRTWAEGDWNEFPRGDSPTLYDAGVGLLLGDLGVYWAKPFGDEAEGSTLTLRLGRRF